MQETELFYNFILLYVLAGRESNSGSELQYVNVKISDSTIYGENSFVSNDAHGASMVNISHARTSN